MGIGEEGSCRVGTILFGIDTIDGLDMDSMITIIISVCSGLIGVLATLWWNLKIEKRDEKVQLFKTLMACRGHIASEENVKALNLVDVVFSDCEEACECLKAFVEAAGKVPFSDEFLVAKYLKLVESIATSLGYKKLDWSRISECVYFPKAIVEKHTEEELLRKASLQNQMALVNERINLPK